MFGGSGERFNTHDSASVLPEHLGGDVSYANNTSVPKGSRLGPDMSDAVMQGAGARGKQPPQHKGRLLRTHLGSYARLPQVTPRGTMVEEHDLGGYSLKKAQDYRGLRDAPPSLPTHNPSSLDTVHNPSLFPFVYTCLFGCLIFSDTIFHLFILFFCQ